MKFITISLPLCNGVGIIGRNGAGKSTLLKIRSRITEPTTGSIKIKGRVASRKGCFVVPPRKENIFLNGAIPGIVVTWNWKEIH